MTLVNSPIPPDTNPVGKLVRSWRPIPLGAAAFGSAPIDMPGSICGVGAAREVATRLSENVMNFECILETSMENYYKGD